jgi:hypothetical protein
MDEQTMISPEIRAFTRELCEKLNETARKPREQIRRIVELCGVDFARDMYEQALRKEAEGGMMLPDGSRRRTLGGVFFYLVRHQVSDDQHASIFPQYKRWKPGEQPLPLPQYPVFEWQKRFDLIQSLLDEQGELNTVKVTLIGRPGRVEKRKDLVITAMSYSITSKTLPKGLPKPPDAPTLYTVYIAAKQWNRVEQAIHNPEDTLIVEGTAAFDPEVGGIAIFAMHVTTRRLEQQHRKGQKSVSVGQNQKPGETSGKQEAKTAAESKPKKSRIAETLANAAALPPPPLAKPSDFPPEIAQKLSELYASASLYRQKIATLQAKPIGQQFGLEMTQKLLKSVEDEIDALEKQHAQK